MCTRKSSLRQNTTHIHTYKYIYISISDCSTSQQFYVGLHAKKKMKNEIVTVGSSGACRRKEYVGCGILEGKRYLSRIALNSVGAAVTIDTTHMVRESEESFHTYSRDSTCRGGFLWICSKLRRFFVFCCVYFLCTFSKSTVTVSTKLLCVQCSAFLWQRELLFPNIPTVFSHLSLYCFALASMQVYWQHNLALIQSPCQVLAA